MFNFIRNYLNDLLLSRIKLYSKHRLQYVSLPVIFIERLLDLKCRERIKGGDNHRFSSFGDWESVVPEL